MQLPFGFEKYIEVANEKNLFKHTCLTLYYFSRKAYLH